MQDVMQEATRMTVLAEDLAPGDIVLLPPVTVHRVTVGEVSVGIVTTDGYPIGYRKGAVVGIIRRAQEVAA